MIPTGGERMDLNLRNDKLLALVGIDEIVPLKDVNISVASYSVQYGLSGFEGTHARPIFREGKWTIGMMHPDLNLKRLFWTAEGLGFELPKYDIEELVGGIMALMVASGYDTTEDGKILHNGKEYNMVYVRPFFVAKPVENIGLGVELEFEIITYLIPMNLYLGERAEKEGIRVWIPKIKRYLPFANLKASSNYPLSIKMKLKAKELGYDEALFLDDEDTIVEGSGENVGIIKGDILKTPPMVDEKGKPLALPGFTMQKIEIIAERMGMKVKREKITREEFLEADAAFLTGNAAGLVAINTAYFEDEEREYKIGDGVKNEKFRMLEEIYKGKIFKGDESFGKWFEYPEEWFNEEEMEMLRRVIERDGKLNLSNVGLRKKRKMVREKLRYF